MQISNLVPSNRNSLDFDIWILIFEFKILNNTHFAILALWQVLPCVWYYNDY